MGRSKWSAKKYANLKVFLPSKEQMKQARKFKNILKKLKQDLSACDNAQAEKKEDL